MTTIEIIAGSMLLLCCLSIIVAVLCQSPKGGKMSGAIMGFEGETVRGRGKATDRQLEKLTKILAIVFFVVTIIVNIVALSVAPDKVDDPAGDDSSVSQDAGDEGTGE